MPTGGRSAGRGGSAARGTRKNYWTQGELDELVRLVERQATTRQIAIELQRTEQSVRHKASRLRLALTAHEVRLGAKRHARREGKVAVAELKSLRQRPTVKVTVNYDFSLLTRQEKRELLAQLTAHLAQEEQPVVAPKAVDRSAAATAHQRERKDVAATKRAALGWMGRAAPTYRIPPEDLVAPIDWTRVNPYDLSRRQYRMLKREGRLPPRKRRAWAWVWDTTFTRKTQLSRDGTIIPHRPEPERPLGGTVMYAHDSSEFVSLEDADFELSNAPDPLQQLIIREREELAWELFGSVYD